jgi:DNA-binding NarL/FixJ family response regulator
MMDRTPVVVLADLFFASKVRAVATSLGAAIGVARNATHLRTMIAELKPRLLLLDLELRGEPPGALIRELKANPGSAALTIIGFASHMNAQAIAAAREAGADRVLARSAFTQLLPRLIDDVFKEGEPQSDGDEKLER